MRERERRGYTLSQPTERQETETETETESRGRGESGANNGLGCQEEKEGYAQYSASPPWRRKCKGRNRRMVMRR